MVSLVNDPMTFPYIHDVVNLYIESEMCAQISDT